MNVLQVADYKAPNLEASGHMQQGMYVPKANVWEELYDPIHVLLRAVHRCDFQGSMDRFTLLYMGFEVLTVVTIITAVLDVMPCLPLSHLPRSIEGFIVSHSIWKDT